jgi:hypothetical protein
MLVNKITKGFQIRSDVNNFNWLKSEEWFVVKDNSPLAQKILKLYPRYDFVLDENEELIDVIEIPKTQEEINEENILEIKKELEGLDQTINRATEDLYELTGTTPYKSTGDVIERKKELRQQLKQINQ